MNLKTKNLNLYNDDLLEELGKHFQQIELRPAGFGITIQEYQEAKGIAEATARRNLNLAVSHHGWSKKRMRSANGRQVWVFYNDAPAQKKTQR